ncbi:MAG TPA: hypothetical protein VGL53_17995 [Bryobacteraceae bacterium]|jgi:hypothetical protein
MQTCAPVKGDPLTQQKALKAFLCHDEHMFGDKLVLIEEPSLELGSARRYNRNEDFGVSNIDATAPVFPIRGSFRLYFCSPISKYMGNQGENCLISKHANAKGLCYKDGWGAWICSMSDPQSSQSQVQGPPPGWSQASAAAPSRNQPNAPQQRSAQPERRAGRPKPDFSEMEKWLEVVRYEYGDNASDHNLSMWVKQKVANVPAFCMQFLDRDGVMVDPADSSCGTGILMHFLPGPGQVAKIDVPMPPEGHMARVVSARVKRQ